MSKNNMYDFVKGKTWNPLGGECPHKCIYCYVENLKRFPVIQEKYSGKIRLDEKAMTKNLGKNNFWFVCSMNDLFADNVPIEYIVEILNICNLYPKNKYLFQTKNPKRFIEFENYFPKNSIFCITVETEYYHNIGNKAPSPLQRCVDFSFLKLNRPKMITIEPIYDFSLSMFLHIIKMANVTQVNIGADSKGNNLPEPSKEKVLQLIDELKKFTKVYIKDNLRRIIGNNYKEGFV